MVAFTDRKTRIFKLMTNIAEWEKLYEVFGLKKDFSNLQLPKKPPYSAWPIVVAQGMTPERIFKKIKEVMPVWKQWNNLDSITSERTADHDYAIWVRDRVEAVNAYEEENDESDEELEEGSLKGITLEECLLLILKYFKETGEHLDEQNSTRCTGSRFPRGDVPFVYWRNDSHPRLYVCGYCVSSVDYPSRPRKVVS